MKKTNKGLSIQINLNGLSFCILDQVNNTIDHLHEFEFDKKLTPHEILPFLKQELSIKPVFSQDFSEVVVVHQNELSSFIPNELYDESFSADYLKYNSKILKSDYIAHDDLGHLEAKNVYVPYVNVNNYIIDTFGQFTYKHSLTVFTDSLMKGGPSNSEDTRVFANLEHGFLELVILRGKSLLLSNSHEFFSKEDLLYFLLFTYQQLELNPESTELILSGSITSDSDEFNLIYKYIRHVQLIQDFYPSPFKGISNNDYSRYFIVLNSI